MQTLRVMPESDQRPSLALELPPETTFDEWVSIGRRLCLTQQALNWHIGDWWAFGDHRYGDRAKAAAVGLFGREFQTLMDLAVVSRAYETSRRREVLSFTHHREVAALSAHEADALLARAERERWSTRDLRRAVQVLKAANDPDGDDVERAPRTIPSQTTRADLIVAYEMVIEFAEALRQLRTLSRREMDLLATAEAFVRDTRASSELANPPANFEVIFREHGRVACEEKYGVSRLTVNHWLIQCGKSRLIKDRADYVRFQRDQQYPRRVVEAHEPKPIDEVTHAIAREAASFLRVSRYGGWTITSTEDGEWLVGTVRRASDELIAMAERQGFDAEAYRRELEAE